MSSLCLEMVQNPSRVCDKSYLRMQMMSLQYTEYTEEQL